MDAPEDSKPIDTLFPNLEDSFVFKYMSELSPIKPDNPVHHNHQELSFTSSRSPPSVFTSPHASYRSQTPLLDAPQPNVSFEQRGLQISSGGEATVSVSYANHAHIHDSSELQENNTHQGGNALVEQLSSKCTIDIPQASMYDCCSPGFDEIISVEPRLFAPVSEIEWPGRNWESITTPNVMQNSMDHPTIGPGNFMPQLPPQNTFRNSQYTANSRHEIRYHTSNPEVATEVEQMPNNLFNFSAMASNFNERMHNEHISTTHQRMLSHPLDYGMARTQSSDSNTDYSTSSQSLKWNVPNDKWLVPTTGDVNSHMCIMPGTGSSIMNNEWPSTRQLGLSNSAPSMHHLSTSQQLDEISSMFPIPQRDLHSQYIWTHHPINYSQPSALIIGEGFYQNRSNRKRHKRDLAGEGKGCKNCKCNYSKCLKLYCECFASHVYCTEHCSCQKCMNKPIYEDTVLAARKAIESRNPLAFASKVIRNADSLPETWVGPNKTPTARHRRGCSCKKSGCQKKYCECYQNGVGCSIRCRCEGCKNAYGKNDGSSKLRTEAETERNYQSCEMLMAEKVLQINEGHSNSAAPFRTPSRPCRSRAPSHSSSRRKQHSNFFIPDYFGFPASQRPNNETILHNQSQFEYIFQSNPELEMPEIQQVGDDCSSITFINNTSNSVSQIINHPSLSFPSLNPHQ